MSLAYLIGVPCGLGCAVLQSVTYIVSRHFTASRGPRASLSLLVLMHLWLGSMGLCTLPFCWSSEVAWPHVMTPLLLAVLFGVLGQLSLTLALQWAEPSRVSPLLTMKVFFPALLTALIGAPVGIAASSVLTIWQWLAVLLCVIAGVSIGRGGGGMRKAAIGAIAFTVVVFAGSDWCVGLTIGRILATPGMTPLRASLLGASTLYLLTGFIAIAVLPTPWGGASADRSSYSLADWRDSFPYAACWYLAMIVLFVAFGEVGVLLGTILQSTRSFITIGIGVGLMYLGVAHIEPVQPRRVVVKRVVAGVLMFLAVVLYVVRDPVAALHLPTENTTAAR